MKQEKSIYRLFTTIMVVLFSLASWADGDNYTLTINASPSIGGTFNVSSATLNAGESIQLIAYASANFSFVEWTDASGEIISKEQEFTYTMPNADMVLTAKFRYNPANPSNPASNHWDLGTGEVIVDDFTTGALAEAITAITNGSESVDIESIIVSGIMDTSDYGIVNTYTNCHLIDFSRVTGINNVPSYAFDNTNLEYVYLPNTIESIGDAAFSGCSQLSVLTVYSKTPPILGNNVFSGVSSELIVYVPSASVNQYKDTNGWGSFTILPIQEDIRKITISLPNGTNVADYAKMWLELTNTKSGQRMHYVLTDRTQYTFSNIIRNTEWNVVLRNERGDVFGQIDNVEVEDVDVNVTFSSLSKPQTVKLSVLSPNEQDVTAQTQITWMDSQGNYISQGTSLSGLPVGYQLGYRAVLSQELAMLYNTPALTEYILNNGNNNIVCQLESINQVQLTGKVKDKTTGLPLSGAVISASQTFGGKYSKTLTAKTDANGAYALTVASVPTSIAYAATDYISQTKTLADIEVNQSLELEDVLLKSITGATITLGFSYTSCDGETQNWYSDYQNVNYELFNVTKNQSVSQYNVQYPQIVLLEEVADGDVLRLTATSRTNAFMPVTATATIVEQKAEATFAVVELGKIKSSFTSTGNAAVVGSLYDSTGKLIKTYTYSNASLTINNLTDGQYSLITMGDSRLFNTIYDLAQLPQTGLIADVDYVRNNVDVSRGVISSVTIDNVPVFDESKFYYTGDNTSFSVNKTNIVVGNYLTLTGRIDFKPTYATSVSNVQMIVDLPESCEFVENSVMVGNSTSSYTINNHQITIPMARYTDRIRFCIIPTLGGEYAPSAFVQFDLNDETITQPIGAANYTVKALSITVPSTVAKTAIPVSGTAIGESQVDIYDNGVLIGQTTSLANGTWAATCELNESYNLSVHNILAKITTKQGVELQTETAECFYNMGAMEVKTVTMINTAHPASNLSLCDYLTVFDFQHPNVEISPYWYWPNYPQFTFMIDIDGGTPERIDNVYVNVKTANGGKTPLKATYDADKGKWIALGNFSSNRLPVNVSVGYNMNSVSISPEEVNSAIQGSLIKNSEKHKNVESIGQITAGNEVEIDAKVGKTNVKIGTEHKVMSAPSPQTKDIVLPLSQTESACLRLNEITNSLQLSLPSHWCQTVGDMLFANSNEREAIREICEEMDEQDVLHIQATIEEFGGPLINGFLGIAENLVEFSDNAKQYYDRIERQRKRLLKLTNCDMLGNESQIDFLYGLLNNLFDQYFRINIMSSAMKCIHADNTSPLASVSFMGRVIEGTSQIAFMMRLTDISNQIGVWEGLCKSQLLSDEEVESLCANARYVIDPSGYVYEGVPSNRIEGVKATAYYKEMVEDMYGDLHENIVKWDGAEYAQENPLFTDENGFYRWDVPNGLWQVKFEKEGYETTYSEWLPVPPPQLDINIPMKQNVQPNVKAARAYEDAVEVEFDKYMIPELLTAENIKVLQNETIVEGAIELLNEEAAYEGATETYASKVRFNATTPFTASEVTLMVNNRVKSYAGIRMQDDFSQTFTIEPEIRNIVCAEEQSVFYGATSTLTVSVEPANAAAGKTLLLKSSSPMILSTSAESVVIDNEGKATFEVNGDLPGAAAIMYSVEGYDLQAMTTFSVKQKEVVAVPMADLASGTTVEEGTEVHLNCSTPGATIYYTLDGSCPCEEATRLTYTGSPIIINCNTTIKAMAVAVDMDDSDVQTFNYNVLKTLNENSTSVPLASTKVNVKVERTINADEWSTICLPFSMTEAQVKSVFGNDVELGDFNGYNVADDGNSINVLFNEATAIEANHPYIIKVSQAVTEFTVDNVDIAPEEKPAIDKGTNSEPKSFIGNYMAGTTIEKGGLFLSDNKFWYSIGSTQIKAFRAYFKFFDLLPDFVNNYVEAPVFISFDNQETGIRKKLLISDEESATPPLYNLNGQRVVTPKNGVYIKNNKKIVVR